MPSSLKILRAAIEVKRRYSQSPALEMSDRCNYQRQRKIGCDWLDWSCWFLRPLDDLSVYRRRCLIAYADMPENWKWTEKRMSVAENALVYLEKKTHHDLWEQGDRISMLL